MIATDDSAAGWFVLGVWLLIALIIAGLILVVRRKVRQANRALVTFGLPTTLIDVKSGTGQSAWIATARDNAADPAPSLAAIAARDPNFNPGLIHGLAETLLGLVAGAWSAGDGSMSQAALDPALWDQQMLQLGQNQGLAKLDRSGALTFPAAAIVAAPVIEGIDSVVIRLAVISSGSRQPYLVDCTLQRTAGAQTAPGSPWSGSCQGCGAPLTLAANGHCQMCNAPASPSPQAWRITALQRVVNGHRQDAKGIALITEASIPAAGYVRVPDPVDVIRGADPSFNATVFLANVQRVFIEIVASARYDVALRYALQGQPPDLSGLQHGNIAGQWLARDAAVVWCDRDNESEWVTVYLYAKRLHRRGDDQAPAPGTLSLNCRFTRAASARSHPGGGLLANRCPSCGAPLELTPTGQCRYCNIEPHRGGIDWALVSIKQGTPPDSLSGYHNTRPAMRIPDPD